MLDFRMDTFIAVCRNLNFTKAAEELNITQPAVSQHIRYLEEYYHCKLFLYQGKKMRLSEEGELLLSTITTMKHDDIYLREKIAQKQEAKQRLIFGATLTAGEFLLPNHLSSFMKKHPTTEVKMVVGNTNELLVKINQGEIDFALIEGYFPKREFDYLPYCEERYVALSACQHPFKKAIHTMEDLLDENIIIREKGSGTREIFEKFISEKNLRIEDFHQVNEIGNIQMIKSLVENDCGITFLYEIAAKEEIKKKRLVEIPMEDFHITHRIHFIWRKNSVFSSYYQNIYQELTSVIKDDTH